MRRDPFGEIGVDGYQLDAQADADQKAHQQYPFRLILQRQQQRKCAVPGQCKHKGRPPPEAVGIRAQQAGADKQAKKSHRGKRRLIGDAEHAVGAEMENAFGDHCATDIAGLKQIVQLKKTA